MYTYTVHRRTIAYWFQVGVLENPFNAGHLLQRFGHLTDAVLYHSGENHRLGNGETNIATECVWKRNDEWISDEITSRFRVETHFRIK